MNISEIQIMWNKIGYDFDDDISLIKNINKQDLKLLWLINSKEISQLENLMSNKIKNRIIAMINGTSNIQDVFHYLINSSWNNIEYEIINISSYIENTLVIYTEHNNKIKEWIPLFYQGERNIILNLGCEWGVKINIGIK